jgi:hypothetical protein
MGGWLSRCTCPDEPDPSPHDPSPHDTPPPAQACEGPAPGGWRTQTRATTKVASNDVVPVRPLTADLPADDVEHVAALIVQRCASRTWIGIRVRTGLSTDQGHGAVVCGLPQFLSRRSRRPRLRWVRNPGTPTGRIIAMNAVASHARKVHDMPHHHHAGEDELLWSKLSARTRFPNLAPPAIYIRVAVGLGPDARHEPAPARPPAPMPQPFRSPQA